jgi:hypothetical protein
MDQSDDIVGLQDPEISVKDIMRLIRERIEARRRKAEQQGLDYFHLVDEANPPETGGTEFSEMAGHVKLMTKSAESLRLSPIVTDWRVPIINPHINRLKNMLHALVLLYVNTLAGRQIAVNRTLGRAVLLLISARQADAARLEALEQEVALLRARLAASERDSAERG